MKVIFCYSKIVRPNQSSYYPVSPITATLESQNLTYLPYGTNVTNTAPSTLMIDKSDKTQYIIPRAYSAVIGALSAVTATNGSVSLL